MIKFILTFVLLISMTSMAESKKDRKPDSNSDFFVTECDKDSDAPTSIVHYVDHKDFAKSSVKLFVTDTDGEPACCSTHALLLIPAIGEGPTSFKCFHLKTSHTNGGAESIALSKVTSKYHPKKGLSLEIPFILHVDGVEKNEKTLKILVNQKKGTVQVVGTQ